MTCDPSLIIIEARSWIGTAFAHQGRCKQAGNHRGAVDCLGLLIGVAEALQLKDRQGMPFSLHDSRNYTKQPDGRKFYETLAMLLEEVCLSSPIMEGDIGLFTMDSQPQHLGLFSYYPAGGIGLIHAYAPARVVVEHVYEQNWHKKLYARFRFIPDSDG